MQKENEFFDGLIRRGESIEGEYNSFCFVP